MPYAYIKLMPGADKGNVLLYIRNMLNELSPSCLPDFEFCDTFSRHLYEKEIQFGDRVILSSVLSIWMALAGILSLVLFDVHYQRREIGITRVYGFCRIARDQYPDGRSGHVPKLEGGE